MSRIPRNESTEARNTPRGFTLIELLVVVTIISLLVAILLPWTRTARYVAQTAVCLANVRSQHMAQTVYAISYRGAFSTHVDVFPEYVRSSNSINGPWANLRRDGVLMNGRVTICPILASISGTFADSTFVDGSYGGWDTEAFFIALPYVWMANYRHTGGSPTIYLDVNGSPEPKWPDNLSEATGQSAMITHRISLGPPSPHDLGHLGAGGWNLPLTGATKDQPVGFGDGHAISRPASEIQPRANAALQDYYY